MKNKVWIILVIAVIIILVIIAFVNKKIDREKTECKIIEGEEVCGKEIQTDEGIEKVYTTQEGDVEVIERYNEGGELQQTERKEISEDRECIEVREPGEDTPMMAGCRPKNQ